MTDSGGTTQMMADHRTALAAIACAGLLLTAGCGGGDEPDPRPADSTTSTPTQTPTAPAWQSKFTDEQVHEYQQALAQWDAYQEASAPIWAEGKYTRQAETIFKQYWHVPQIPEQRLKEYESLKAQLHGTQRVLSSGPVLVEAGLVRIRQCVDASEASFTVNGEVQAGAKHPFVRVVDMDKPEGQAWLIVRVQDPAVGWTKRCAE